MCLLVRVLYLPYLLLPTLQVVVDLVADLGACIACRFKTNRSVDEVKRKVEEMDTFSGLLI